MIPESGGNWVLCKLAQANLAPHFQQEELPSQIRGTILNETGKSVGGKPEQVLNK
jgi:hypothetical protein